MFAESQLLLGALEYPRFRDSLPNSEIREGKYCIRFAKSREELDGALRLRFDVFNLELGEGLDSSFQTGRDSDDYDLDCHHLIVVESQSDKVVGTYRLQTGAMAAASRGFYSACEFDLSHLPLVMLEDSVELGRACIAKSHRNTQVLFLLWKGLAAYVAYNRKRYLFGCCSLTSQDPREGKLTMEMLERDGYLHPNFYVAPKPEFKCHPTSFTIRDTFDVKLPKLFKTYLRFGAKVCGPPAIDRGFKTIDFFVIFDVFQLDKQTQRMFFGV